jgi:hypothetical protein
LANDTESIASEKIVLEVSRFDDRYNALDWIASIVEPPMSSKPVPSPQPPTAMPPKADDSMDRIVRFRSPRYSKLRMHERFDSRASKAVALLQNPNVGRDAKLLPERETAWSTLGYSPRIKSMTVVRFVSPLFSSSSTLTFCRSTAADYAQIEGVHIAAITI